MPERITIFHIEKMFPELAPTIDYLIQHTDSDYTDTLKETGKNLWLLYTKSNDTIGELIANGLGLSERKLWKFYLWTNTFIGSRIDPETGDQYISTEMSDWEWALLLLGFSPDEIMEAYEPYNTSSRDPTEIVDEDDGERRAEMEAEHYIKVMDEDYDRTHRYDRFG